MEVTVYCEQMNVAQVYEKVNVWQAAAQKMKDNLPQDDQLLAHFYQLLQDFKQDLPLLHKLSSTALKVSS